MFGEDLTYASLELPDVQAAAQEDPRGFLDAYRPPVIFDEIQHAPGLLPYIKEQIDARRDQTGQYVLTGSQNILLAEKVTESLAGRAGVLRLLPLSHREIAGKPNSPFPWERTESLVIGEVHPQTELWRSLLRGSYPELVANPERDAALWHGSYIQTYLERDVRTVRQVGDLSQFQSFLRALAARSAQLLNMAELARDLGLALNTVKAWLSVLETTYQVIVLRPYLANVGKRLVKTPKVYFTDVGTLSCLVGLKDPDHAAAGPMGGPIMETAVLSELVKTLAHRGVDPKVYFWRTTAGSEVDIILETGSKLVPIEVKLSATPRPTMASSLRQFRESFPNAALPGYVVHPGHVHTPLGHGVWAVPFSCL